jgi:hypothetical protein
MKDYNEMPCLAENWFVEDSMENGLCDHRLLYLFGDTKEKALRQVYRMSRAIRCKHVKANRIDYAKTIDNDHALRFIGSIEVLNLMSIDVYSRSKVKVISD